MILLVAPGKGGNQPVFLPPANCPVVRTLLFPSSFMLPLSSFCRDGGQPYTRGHKATKEILQYNQHSKAFTCLLYT